MNGDWTATKSRDFNLDNNYGRSAVEILPRSAMGEEAPLVPPPSSNQGEFTKEAAEALVGSGLLVEADQHRAFYDVKSINKLLNSILGMLSAILNSLFEYFINTIEAVVAQAKKSGRSESELQGEARPINFNFLFGMNRSKEGAVLRTYELYDS